jgi:PmbA protein
MKPGASGRAEEFVGNAVREAVARPRCAAADAYHKESRHRRWVVSPGETVRTGARQSGFAVRLFRGDGRVGHASASGSGPAATLEAVLETAGGAADRCSPEVAEMPPGAWEPPDLDLFDPTVEQVPVVEGLLLRIESAVLEEGRGEVEVQSLVAVAGSSRVAMATSAGFAGAYLSSLVTVLLALRAGRGGEVAFHRTVVSARHLATMDADRLGRGAVRRARLALEGGTVRPGPIRVALEPQVACLLLEHLVPSLEADAAGRGRSSLPAAEAGAVVASSAISLVDDPSLRRGVGSMPFDGEARPVHRRALIDSGALGPLLGAAVDRRGGRVGAALRPSYTDPPRRGPSNLHLARGERSPGNLLADAGTVLRVSGATLLGRGGPASGEIVLSASGELLESGEPAGAVREVTLVGRAGELLSGVLEVGNDLSFHLRGCALGSPTVLLNGMWIP